MSETITKPAEGAQADPTPQQGDKTFTQEDLNRIVSERLAREKEKAGAELEQREKELNAREFRLKAQETLAEKKLPADLLDAMNCADDETFNKSLEIIEKYMGRTVSGGYRTGMRQTGAEGGECDSLRKAMGLPE